MNNTMPFDSKSSHKFSSRDSRKEEFPKRDTVPMVTKEEEYPVLINADLW